jgi:hypothetical protein
MARLTETEKVQLLRPIKIDAPVPPSRLSFRDYLEFATFASRFNRGTKPVRFKGKYWRL